MGKVRVQVSFEREESILVVSSENSWASDRARGYTGRIYVAIELFKKSTKPSGQGYELKSSSYKIQYNIFTKLLDYFKAGIQLNSSLQV